MSNGLFILIILCIGLCLAWYVDRLRSRTGGGRQRPSAPPSDAARERAKWLYFWYLGRFPSREADEDAQSPGTGQGKDGKPRS